MPGRPQRYIRDFALIALALSCAANSFAKDVERWGVYELSLPGPAAGNPYLDIHVGAHFRYAHRTIDVEGFYDGDGAYRVRFMPDEIGNWTYATFSNAAALDNRTGAFTVTTPSPGNHGPV